MTQNEVDRRKLYERIDAIQDSLITAWGGIDSVSCPLSGTQLKALMLFDQ